MIAFTIPGTPLFLSQCMEEEDKEEYGVEKIIGDRVKSNRRYFLVKWEGCPESEASYEPEENLEGCRELVDRYLQEKAEREARGEQVDTIKEVETKQEQEEMVQENEINEEEQEKKTEPDKELENEKPEDEGQEIDTQTTRKKHHFDESSDFEEQQISAEISSSSDVEPKHKSKPQQTKRTSNIVTRLQYQKQWFGEYSDSAAIASDESSDERPKKTKPSVRKKPQSPKKNRAKDAKKKKRPVYLSGSDDKDLKCITGVTLAGRELTFTVRRHNGKSVSLSKEELLTNHTRLYHKFLEKLVSWE